MAATLLLYFPCLSGQFLWDDVVLIRENPVLRGENALVRIWLTREPYDYWPLTYSIYWLNWHLWGEWTFPYHVQNVLLHALNALLLWHVLHLLAVRNGWLSSLVFALHPVNVEAVAWIVQLKTLLSSALFFAALICYLRYRDRQSENRDTGGTPALPSGYYLALLLYLLALLAKTSVVILPVVMLIVLWHRQGRLGKRDLIETVPFALLSILLGAIGVWFQYARAIGSHVIRTDTVLERLCCAGWAVWFYLGKTVVPVGLTFVYPRWQIDATRASSYVPLAGVLLTLVVAWHWRRRWGRLPLTCWSYYVVALLPVLGLVDIYFMRYSFVADHWQYLAIGGIIPLLLAMMQAFLRGICRLRAGAVGALSVLLLAVLATLTWRQQGIYRNEGVLWQDTLAKNPTCGLAHTRLGLLCKESGDLRAAEHHYLQALQLRPDFHETHSDLAVIFTQRGMVSKAIEHYRRALAIHPFSAATHSNLGRLLGDLGQYRQALEHLRQAIRLDPGFAKAHNNLGNVLLAQDKLKEAEEHYQTALSLMPDFAEAHSNLGALRLKQGKSAEAFEQYSKALQLDSSLVPAHWGLGLLLACRGQAADAVEHYRHALAAQPGSADMARELAWILAADETPDIRDGNAALRLAEHANRLTGNRQPACLDALAAALAETGRFTEAAGIAQEAERLAKENGKAPLADAIRNRRRLYESGRPFRFRGRIPGGSFDTLDRGRSR